MPEPELASRILTKVSLVLSLEHPVGGSAPHELFVPAERANRLALVTPPAMTPPFITIIVEGED